jgi:hypothetical protein
MCPNILTAIKSISEFKNNDLKDYSAKYHIRINQVGEQLEYYVKDAVVGSFKSVKNQEELAYCETDFSYSGNQNNPPDFIITRGDAFEIKKIEAVRSSLALNNSPPKDRLYRDDPRITQHCRSIDGGDWKSKDIFYVVGCTPKKAKGKLKYLFFVHGLCYAAEKSIYESKAVPLKNNIDTFFKANGWETTETNELGRINRMDPLGITNFRIRGMWEIENPLNVFPYVYRYNDRQTFSLAVIMTAEKYKSFPEKNRETIEKDANITSKSVKIKNPNNPAQLMDAQLVTLGW